MHTYNMQHKLYKCLYIDAYRYAYVHTYKHTYKLTYKNTGKYSGPEEASSILVRISLRSRINIMGATALSSFELL